MPHWKRLLQTSVLAVCVLSSTAVFAADAPVVTSPEAPALQEEIDFGALFTPEPMNRSCSATSACTPVGGIPVSCAGNSSCLVYANWVTCDGTPYPCTCNPEGMNNCLNPEAFCECWNLAPLSNYITCRRQYCLN